jgi:ATP-binding cassette subfamily B (MDR/TAP) protein 1
MQGSTFMTEANKYALIFFLLGLLGLLMSVIQNAIFAVIGEGITRQIRSETFYKLMKLPIYWYEKPKNNVGSLTARLAVDCKQVK